METATFKFTTIKVLLADLYLLIYGSQYTTPHLDQQCLTTSTCVSQSRPALAGWFALELVPHSSMRRSHRCLASIVACLSCISLTLHDEMTRSSAAVSQVHPEMHQTRTSCQHLSVPPTSVEALEENCLHTAINIVQNNE